jgi:hypothetical protein
VSLQDVDGHQAGRALLSRASGVDAAAERASVKARRRARLPLALLLTATACLYLVDLAGTPVYFGGDEAHFAVHAHAIARTGHDLDGRAFPLLFSLADPLGDPNDVHASSRWYQPTLLYLLAGTLRIAPLSITSARLPAAIVGGILSPLLVYLVAMRLLHARGPALFAAAAFALAPAHVILSRQAVDYVLPIPFVLGWLWCLFTFLERGDAWLPAAGGLLLGAGLFSYIGSWIFMPLCAALSCAACARARRTRTRAIVSTMIAFAGPALVLAVWVAAHPVMLRQTVGRYDLAGPAAAEPAPRTGVLFLLRGKVSEYWDYFDPAFLFLSGGTSMTASTGRTGVLLLPVAVFLCAGLYELVARRPSTAGAVAVAGFVLAPIPATLAGERYMIQREIVVAAFAALIAAAGASACFASRRRTVRSGALLLIALMPLQFALFYRDYFTHYKLRSAIYYDPAAFADVVGVLLAADAASPLPRIYLSHELDDPGARWRFYTTRAGREDLLRRTTYFVDIAEVGAAPRGSCLVISVNRDAILLAQDPQWSVVTRVLDVDRREAAVVFRKVL